jgi:serine/threonine protein kinase
MSQLILSTRQTGYLEMLRSTRLWPVDPQLELNWSGRGQHVEYKSGDLRRINKLLIVQRYLGDGISGYVESVKCRRISLARKTIHTRKCRFTKEQAIEEVIHMTKLKHSHVIRLIGSYVREENLCILMYPVADNNLEEFLKTLSEASTATTGIPLTAMASACLGFFSCLSSALRYIHCNLLKHMDIKPRNVLVRTRRCYKGGGRSEYNSKVYISDFGIARSYQSIDAVNTDGYTAFTRKYAAPEVVRELGPRGLSADVFSLGCVFLEMFVALDSYMFEQAPKARSALSTGSQETQDIAQTVCKLQDALQRLLESNCWDRTYQGNLDPIKELLTGRMPQYNNTSVLSSSTLQTILEMIQFVPTARPDADDLVREFGEKACCNTGPEKLEADDENWEDRAHHYPDRTATGKLLQPSCEEACCKTGSEDLEAADENWEGRAQHYIPDLMTIDQILQQSGEAVSYQEGVRPATFWEESALAGLTEDHHLLRQVDEWVEHHPVPQPLLMDRM